MAWVDNFDLNREANFRIVTGTVDGKGGVTYTQTELESNVPCAIWQTSAVERFVSDRVKNESSHILFSKIVEDVEADHVVVDVGTYTYKITRPDDILYRGDVMIVGLRRVDE